MASESRDSTVKTHEEILARIRGLTAGIRDGAAAAEEARTVVFDSRDPIILNRVFLSGWISRFRNGNLP
jgi:hypothetical protein